MKISFDDKSSVEFRNSDKPGFIYIIISAKDKDNQLKKITNSVEITSKQFKELQSDLNL